MSRLSIVYASMCPRKVCLVHDLEAESASPQPEGSAKLLLAADVDQDKSQKEVKLTGTSVLILTVRSLHSAKPQVCLNLDPLSV
ncbi:hypothetical protein D9758_006180 [Tetrapyrgos nigripes]|uniref:Uncharacterized protein n=1 Tax=Tetrapyrgos nigripes TaxID=182062 RepID=A0A8H5LLF3_9AGAR|nr:hypothetical protein D9758_006180 [Tetrapyrgos nigripes]